MLEKRNDALLPLSKFILRIGYNLALCLLIIAIALLVGMIGYHHYEHMSWVDAYVNAAMILSGMGPLGQLMTVGGKIFAGSYALFSGLVFITIMGLIFAPFIHRLLHKFHI